ncbi:TPA: hypothetical protein ACWMBN_005634 [Klebsiella pneumoniae]|uniref:hypothetical protein n=1 Tax=Klebsiella quasipneumoniae TaxID=1463165 RepID=UPI0021AC490B|nr:hypothetical protein [Klebsiella quasipneumoniae]UVG18943.1 hypothetical protein NWT75_14360 [Klebsiella quasipneumoniae]HCI5762617.1 hypothetical protein [Klebsiella quasipneumoniae subsp. quasipneumoniae]HDT2605358.1 hypothetical protein [Klebsiella quasipneumoniae subsp. similipneumoniae]
MKISEMVSGDKIVLQVYDAEFTAVSDAVQIQDDEAPGFCRVDGALGGEPMVLTAPGDTEYDRVE